MKSLVLALALISIVTSFSTKTAHAALPGNVALHDDETAHGLSTLKAGCPVCEAAEADPVPITQDRAVTIRSADLTLNPKGNTAISPTPATTN